MTPPAAQANAEAVIASLNVLRNEQRSLASKLAELQMDLNEHKLVIDTLVGVDPERRCFRLVGGVLVEQKDGCYFTTCYILLSPLWGGV